MDKVKMMSYVSHFPVNGRPVNGRMSKSILLILAIVLLALGWGMLPLDKACAVGEVEHLGHCDSAD